MACAGIDQVKADICQNIYGPDEEITPRGMTVVFTKMSDEDRKIINDKGAARAYEI